MPRDPSTEADLLPRIAAGDLEAFATLYDRYGATVYGFCLRLLRERGAAEDATQEVFLKLWRAAAGFDPMRGTLRSWLLAITHRECLDRLRARRPETPADPTEWEIADPGAGPVEEAERAAEAGGVRQALAGLQADQRRALALMYYGGYSQSEIATQLGVPLGTIKGRVRLGLQALRRTMAPEGVDDGGGRP